MISTFSFGYFICKIKSIFSIGVESRKIQAHDSFKYFSEITLSIYNYLFNYCYDEGVCTQNLLGTIFVNFTKAFDSIHRRKMEQILLAYGLPKETVPAMMILYRNIKVKVHSPDGDTDYFDIVAGVLQGDTLASYLFIISLDYVLRTSIDKIKENSFKLTKERSRRYSAKTITNTDNIALLANTPAQAKTLLHSLEWAAAGIGLHVNAHKMEYMFFNQTGDISTLNGNPLELVD